VIGRFGLGVDNIDIKTAAELGITVTYVPDYCMHEVSDHALALLLALARNSVLERAGASRRWEMPAVVPLRRLAGQVLGLIGFGNIPRALAPKAKALGLKVITHDPYSRQDVIAAHGVEGVSFDELLARSDFVSVHAPLTPATRGLVNAAAFARMKKGALIVNTARGPLIDEPALIAALDSRPSAAPRSTWWRTSAGEGLSAHRPRQRDPHAAHAFYSVEALESCRTKCVGDVARVLCGEPPAYR